MKLYEGFLEDLTDKMNKQYITLCEPIASCIQDLNDEYDIGLSLSNNYAEYIKDKHIHYKSEEDTIVNISNEFLHCLIKTITKIESINDLVVSVYMSVYINGVHRTIRTDLNGLKDDLKKRISSEAIALTSMEFWVYKK